MIKSLIQHYQVKNMKMLQYKEIIAILSQI